MTVRRPLSAWVTTLLRGAPRRTLSKRTPPGTLERQPQERSIVGLRVAADVPLPTVGDVLLLGYQSLRWLNVAPAYPEGHTAVRVEGVHVPGHSVSVIPLPPEDSPQLGAAWWRYTGGRLRPDPRAMRLAPPPDLGFEREA